MFEHRPERRPYSESEPRQFPDDFLPAETEKQMDELLIAYMSRRLGLGWEDIAKRLPDVPTDVIRSIVFCKHVGLAPGLQSEADFPQGHRRGT